MTDTSVEDLENIPAVWDGNGTMGETALLVNATAELENSLIGIKENMDVFFILIIAFIVFFLQAGFAFLEVGAVRSKNATNILIKNMLDVFLGGIAFWLVGYPIAFGEGNGLIGTTYWASSGLPDLAYAHWAFQFVFAATAATIVSGSVAERCAFSAYFIYSIMLTGFVYPVVAHWAWSSDGWLVATSYHDFAGSGVVHLTGGVSALMGAIMLGPRIGRFDCPNAGSIPGHSVPLAGLGGFILLFGFLAFNGGSQGSISQPGDAAVVARAVVNTIIAGCSGGLSVLLTYRAGGTSTWSFLMTLNGALAGMVSICSGCDVHRPWGAMVTGMVAGLVFLAIHMGMIRLKIDDPLDAVAVHMGGGMWGLIATPLFMDHGLVYGHTLGVKVITWNLVGMLTIILWAGGVCFVMFGILKLLKMLRVSEEMEMKGMDILKHGEPAYPVDAWIEEQYYSRFHDKEVGRKNSVTNRSHPPPPPPPLLVGLPANMNPPSRGYQNHPRGGGGAGDELFYTSNSSFYPQNPHYWSMPDSRRLLHHHYGGPPNCAMNSQGSLPPPSGMGSKQLHNQYKKTNGKLNGYHNGAMEMIN